MEMAGRHLEPKSVGTQPTAAEIVASQKRPDDEVTGKTVWLFENRFQAIFYRFNEHGCGLYLQPAQ
jgi:hypothetical protein